LSVLTEIHNRGVKDILIACVDGLTGFPNAIETVFPKTQVQLCIVHMVRNSVAFVPWQHRKQVCADLKAIYSAATESEAEFNLELCLRKMGQAISVDLQVLAQSLGEYYSLLCFPT
jgi:putative transposase